MQIHIIKVNWQSHAEALQTIRTAVFVVEQDVEPEDEWDDEDKIADHFLAVNEAGQALGCARLVASGQIGRMAVLAEHRRQGLGARLLEAAVNEAKAQKMARVFLHAQAYVEDFYRREGFVTSGPQFSEVGIKHVPMEMIFPIEFDAPAVNTKPEVRDVALPASETTAFAPRNFSSIVQARDALTELITNSNRQIFILNPHLDHDLFDQEQVVDALSAFARRAARAEIRILIMSSKLIVDRGHRLLEIARRLDSKITFRRYDQEITDSTSTFCCGDTTRYWMMPVHDQYEGIYDANNVVLTKRFRQTFTSAWDKSSADPELRILRI